MTHISAETAERLHGLVEFVGVGRPYSVTHWQVTPFNGQRERVIELHLPVIHLNAVAPWRAVVDAAWTAAKAVYSTYYPKGR